MYYSILETEPIVVFFLSHVILFITTIILIGLSSVKKLQPYKSYFDKANLLIVLAYFGFHAFCVCMLVAGVFTSHISGLFWLIFYLKFFISMGLFVAILIAIATVLAPFGILVGVLRAAKRIIKL